MADVRTRQIDIQKSTAELAKSIGATDRKERLTIKRVLSGLAFGDMLEAVALCDAMLKGHTPPTSRTADVPPPRTWRQEAPFSSRRHGG